MQGPTLLRVRRICAARFALGIAAIALLTVPLLAVDMGPWDLAALRKPPTVTWISKTDSVSSLLLEGETYQEKPTRVFAFYLLPKNITGKIPAILVLQGAAGCVLKPGSSPLFAARGYAALEIDLGGCGPLDYPRDDRMPAQNDGTNVGDRFYVNPADPQWFHSNALYHTLAASMRGVSFLYAQPEVDTSRVGVIGNSWGGYHTCMLIGHDDRLKVAVSTFGAGFFENGSYWGSIIRGLPTEQRTLWNNAFEASNWLALAKIPMLWVTGVNDPYFYLDSWYKSGLLVQGPRYRHLDDRGHGGGWDDVQENFTMFDHYLRNGPDMLRFTDQGRTGTQAWATYTTVKPKSAALWYTTGSDSTAWTARVWTSTTAASIDTTNKKLTANTPSGSVICFFSTTDAANNTSCSELINISSTKLPAIPPTAIVNRPAPGLRAGLGGTHIHRSVGNKIFNVRGSLIASGGARHMDAGVYFQGSVKSTNLSRKVIHEK